MGCVYLATHIESGRVYVGQTNDTARIRWSSHVYAAKHRALSYFDKSLSKYGLGSFILQELSRHESQEELDNSEKVAIVVFSATDRRFGFNTRCGGSRGKHSEATKQKMSAAKKMQTIETRVKLSAAANKRWRKWRESNEPNG